MPAFCAADTFGNADKPETHLHCPFPFYGGISETVNLTAACLLEKVLFFIFFITSFSRSDDTAFFTRPVQEQRNRQTNQQYAAKHDSAHADTAGKGRRDSLSVGE